MRYRELGRPGRPGLRASEIGLSTREIGGTVWVEDADGIRRPYGFGSADDEESLRMVARARDLGINFVLTSPTHGAGRAEEVLGRTLRSDRNHWVLGVMGGISIQDGKLERDISHESLSVNLQSSLKHLGTSDVDLFMVQGVSKEELASGACADALNRVAKSGIAGFVGADVSLADIDLDLVLKLDMDVVRIRYNIFEPLAGSFFARAKAGGIGIVADGVLADGFLGGKFTTSHAFDEDDERSLVDSKAADELISKARSLSFLVSDKGSLAQASLLYVLANQAVTVALTGASTAAEIEEDAMAGSTPRLSEEMLDRIGKLQRTDFQP